MDAIQEVTILTSNFAAEYGQVGGGFLNYTMKSGTNELHGSAYDYLTNEALNAGHAYDLIPYPEAKRALNQILNRTPLSRQKSGLLKVDRFPVCFPVS